MPPINRRLQGRAGEALAATFLERNGFKILERNFRFERCEIDLIAEDGDEIVFVEVKARRSSAYGSPEDAVTEEKQEHVYTAAEGYLYVHDIDHRPCRFDVIAIEYHHGTTEIRHIRNAF